MFLWILDYLTQCFYTISRDITILFFGKHIFIPINKCALVKIHLSVIYIIFNILLSIFSIFLKVQTVKKIPSMFSSIFLRCWHARDMR